MPKPNPIFEVAPTRSLDDKLEAFSRNLRNLRNPPGPSLFGPLSQVPVSPQPELRRSKRTAKKTQESTYEPKRPEVRLRKGGGPKASKVPARPPAEAPRKKGRPTKSHTKPTGVAKATARAKKSREKAGGRPSGPLRRSPRLAAKRSGAN